MAKERLLTPEQRARYNKILENKGKEEADAYKTKVGGKGSDSAAKGTTTEDKPKKKKPVRLSPELKEVKKDFVGADKIADQLGLTGPLDKVDLSGLTALTDPTNPGFQGDLSPEEQDLLARLSKQASDSVNPDGSAKIDPNNQKVIDQLQKAYEEAGMRPADVQSMLDGVKKNWEDAGVMTPGQADVLNKMRQNVEDAKTQDQKVTDAIGRMEEGLAGYDSKSAQALKEAALRSSKGKLEQAQIRLDESAARNKMTGGAAFSAQRQLEKEGFAAQQAADQDLLIANEDLKDKRLDTYSKYVQGVDKDKKSAVDSALSTLGVTQTDIEKLLANSKLEAGKTYASATLDATKNESDAKSQAGKDLSSMVSAAVGQADLKVDNSLKNLTQGTVQTSQTKDARLAEYIRQLMAGQEFNAGQGNAEKAGNLTALTGILGVKTANQTAKTQEKIASGDGNSRPRGNDNSTTDADSEAYRKQLQAIQDALKKQQEEDN
jgi:hypothetical protein